MSAPEELSFDKILQFMLQNGGRVTNHELVKHFKMFLTDPTNRAESRETFKKHVNTLASIKNHNNEKWLILKRKYMVTNKGDPLDSSCDIEQQDVSELEVTMSPTSPVAAVELNPRSPPPYKSPPEFSPKLVIPEAAANEIPSFPISVGSPESPSVAKLVFECEMKENEPRQRNVEESFNIPHGNGATPQPISTIIRNESPNEMRRSVSAQENIQNVEEGTVQLRSDSISTLYEKEQNILVKERKKIFTRSNGEGDVVKPRTLATRKSANRIENQKRSSVMPHLDPKGHEWIVRASAGDYEALARMCNDNPSIVRTKDPSMTALHWACKRGDERLVNMLASLARQTVHERTNGGYTPLHIAMQFRHENIYKMLVDVFDADPNVADYSGRKPRQYPVNVDTWCSTKKAATKQADKDLGFLRIGSLNLRVKKTTEAFSNFLGVGVARTGSHVGGPRGSPTHQAAARRTPPDHEHLKSWGSADNIPKENRMPPPSQQRVKRRMGRGRGGGDAQSRSTPSTPNQPRALLALGDDAARHARLLDPHDSDSDSAAGFHAAWQAKRSSAN